MFYEPNIYLPMVLLAPRNDRPVFKSALGDLTITEGVVRHKTCNCEYCGGSVNLKDTMRCPNCGAGVTLK